ncbi:ABC-type dipeptide/oligopeptide/nickel transport system ATPase component/uncharacterized membrane protein YeaQ/YmgE (transglycosylase-associated protein family) [Bradyrhizobium sp. LM3.4]
MTKLVEISGLNIRFTGERTVYAVNDLSLSLGDGEVLGLLGESGSGKSVTLRALMRLLPKKRTQIAGKVNVMGRDVLAMNDEQLSSFRGQTVSMIFQEPALALDPVYTIGAQIAESVVRHEGKSYAEGRARALDMLEVVRIPSAKRRLDAYPHEMSGGMRQRAMIALALACRPKILLADEPTTALDATVQIQILLLLRELQREFGMSVIFVTHDIGVAIEICDRVAVMYAGQIVEQGTLRDIVRSPVHPYAKGLLALHRSRRETWRTARNHPRHAALVGRKAPQLLLRPPLRCGPAPLPGATACGCGSGSGQGSKVCARGAGHHTVLIFARGSGEQHSHRIHPGSGSMGRSRRGTSLMYISNEGLLVILFVGLVAGWLAGKVVRGTGFGIIGDIVVGIAGALVASFLFPKLGIHIGTGLISEIVYSAIGAVILLLVVRLVRGGGRF